MIFPDGGFNHGLSRDKIIIVNFVRIFINC